MRKSAVLLFATFSILSCSSFARVQMFDATTSDPCDVYSGEPLRVCLEEAKKTEAERHQAAVQAYRDTLTKSGTVRICEGDADVGSINTILRELPGRISITAMTSKGIYSGELCVGVTQVGVSLSPTDF